MVVDPKPSTRYSQYVRLIICDEWESLGRRGNDKGVLRHKVTGKTVAYNLHDGGNDWNGPRNFAAEVQRECGCRLIEARGRKRSRKAVPTSDEEVEVARRKHLEEHGERLDQEARRREMARRTAASLRRERDIADLMRPGR